MHFFRTLATATCLVVVGLASSVADGSAQYRRDAGTTLRAKSHDVTYTGVLQIVGEVGGQEQYRLGPDTIGLEIRGTVESGATTTARYRLDLGEGEPAEGEVEFSELGLPKDMWRPALEGLTLVTLLPLPSEEITAGFEWAELVTYTIPEIDLDFAEATQFRVESLDDGLATIAFSSEGGGSTTIDRPMLGEGAKMDITRESAREGYFVFSVEDGYVVRSHRLERTTTISTVFAGGDPQAGPTETQTVTFDIDDSSGR